VNVRKCLSASLAALTVVGAAALPAWGQTRPAAPSGAAPAAAAAPASAGTTVVVIDLQDVFENHVRYKAAMENINRDHEQINAQFRNDQKELQKMIEQLKDLKPGSPEYKRQEEATAQYESNLRVQAQLKRKEIAERQAKLLYQTYEEVTAAVQSFSDRNGIGLVLQFTADEIDPANPQSIMRGVNRPVVYQRNLNITKYIIDAVNAGTPPAQPAGGISNRPAIPGAGGNNTLRQR
jgi:Skp family chaperone for outer membrane proteins